MKKFLLLAAIAAICGCAAGKRPRPASASSGAPELERPEAEARATLRDMQAAYEAGRAEDFLHFFDRRDFTNYDAYQDFIRDFLIHNHQITLDIIVDDVVGGDGEISVKVHWNRRYVDDTGALKLGEGKSEIIFQPRSSGGLMVVAIYGNSPF